MGRSANMLAIVGIFLVLTGTPKIASAQTKVISVGIKVEAEGGTTSRGLWTQSANDLTPKELKTLEALTVQQIQQQPGITIVPLTYKEDFVGVVVVAAKVAGRNSGVWYVASSVILVSKKNGTDEFVTHDVLAGPDLPSVARSVSAQLAAARIGAALGISK